jgi:hypothetical protein
MKKSYKALGNFFKTEKQILKADIQKLIKTNQINDEKVIAELLKKDIDVDKAIYFAISHGSTLKQIKTLISLSASKLPNEYLYKAVNQGRLDLVQYFIEEKNFDVNTTINNPLHGGLY